jgi:hypothetical protein
MKSSIIIRGGVLALSAAILGVVSLLHSRFTRR